MSDLASIIDHTALAADTRTCDVARLCDEAVHHGFYAVCVSSRFVPLARKLLEKTDVKIACVIGFPLGSCSTEAKVCETVQACREGAHEFDMVMNIGALKENLDDYVLSDIRAVVGAARAFGCTVKVILETAMLTDDEIVRACGLAEHAGAAFVKTSTGFSHGGATEHHVALMRQSVGNAVRIKASGGIRDRKTAEAMVAAGADRIGASASVAIVED